MRDIAAFRSGRFKPMLPDACQVDPRTYGFELASWLAGKLARQGVVTSYPVAGDAGWVLASGASMQVLCANADGSDVDWRLSLIGCDGSSREEARRLVNAIRFVLHAAARPEDIDWRYDNEDCPGCKQMPRM